MVRDVVAVLLPLAAVAALAAAAAHGAPETRAAPVDRCPPQPAIATEAPVVPPDRIEVRANPVLVAGKDGSGSTTLSLCLPPGAEPVPLQLSIDHFSTGGPQSALLPRPQLKPAPAVLQPDGCVDVGIDATRLTGAATMQAALRQRGQVVARVAAVQSPVPFTLQAVGADKNRLPLTLVRDEAGSLTIRNADDSAHRVAWQWDMAGTHCRGVFDIGPRATRAFDVPRLDADADYNWWTSGFLRSASERGTLTLTRALGPGFDRVLPETQPIEIDARLNYHGPIVQRVVNLGFTLLLLLLGVLASLTVHFALPTQRRRVALKQRLADMRADLDAQRNVAEMRTLSALRVEIDRLNAAVGAGWPIFPQVETDLAQHEMRTAALERRIALTRDASACRVALEAITRDAGALLTAREAERIDQRCRNAIKVAEMAAPGDADLRRAADEVAAAGLEMQLQSAGNADPDAAALALLRGPGNAQPALRGLDPLAAAPGGAPPTAAQLRLWRDIEALLRALGAEYARANLPAVTRADYIAADRALWKAELLRDYEAAVRSAVSDAVYVRRLDRGDELLAALRPGAGESARMARRVLREVQQDITPADVAAALPLPPNPALAPNPQAQQACIALTPPRPNAFQLALLSVCLRPPPLDDAEARKRFRCAWTVDGEPLDGNELSVQHYFERKRSDQGRYTITATVTGPDGTQYAPLQKTDVEVAPTPNFGRSDTLLSLSNLAVTVTIIVVGLIATAQDKLLALDWLDGAVAVFVIGFTADVLKRALTKTS